MDSALSFDQRSRLQPPGILFYLRQKIPPLDGQGLRHLQIEAGRTVANAAKSRPARNESPGPALLLDALTGDLGEAKSGRRANEYPSCVRVS